MSHAIPNAAFKALMTSGNGKAIGIPNCDQNAHFTSDSGAAPLLCRECEARFNREFDGPAANALKELENKIITDGFGVSIAFPSDQMAHAIVSIAWRICLSPAALYRDISVAPRHMNELDTLLRKPRVDVLRHCSVKISRLSDPTREGQGGFSQDLMHQFIKTPEVFSIPSKRTGSFDRFAMDWTMFGFLIHLIVPKLTFPASQKFGGLKRGSTQIKAPPVDLLEYAPLRNAIVSGYAAQAEGRVTRGIRKRDALKDATATFDTRD